MKLILPLSLSVALAGCVTPKAPLSGYEQTWAEREVMRNEARISRIETQLFEQLQFTHVRLIGMVKSPGLFDVTKKDPFMPSDLIEAAYGFDRTAYVRKIHVTRKVNGEIKTYSFDMSKEGAAKGSGDIKLLPGDLIFVPEIMK